LNKKFEEHGRMFSSGKVVKLRFNSPESYELRLFAFKDDIKRLFDGNLDYVRLFLDREVNAHGEEKSAE
jgi:hypothetical protein